MFKKLGKVGIALTLSVSMFLGSNTVEVNAKSTEAKIANTNKVTSINQKQTEQTYLWVADSKYNIYLQNYTIKKPDIKVFDGKKFKDIKSLNKLELNNLKYIEQAYYEHMAQLRSLGMNLDNLEDFQIVLDTSKFTYDTGGYYIYTTHYHTVNRNNFKKNTIALSLHLSEHNLKNDIAHTFVHEFGHHIGYSEYHFGANYSRYFNLFDNSRYITDEKLGKYTPSWRNLPFEQFAESYLELFTEKPYQNRSATPSMNAVQKNKLLHEILYIVNHNNSLKYY